MGGAMGGRVVSVRLWCETQDAGIELAMSLYDNTMTLDMAESRCHQNHEKERPSKRNINYNTKNRPLSRGYDIPFFFL